MQQTACVPYIFKNQINLSIEIYIHTADNGTLLLFISVNFCKVLLKTN